MKKILFIRLKGFLTPLVAKHRYTLRVSARELAKDGNVSYMTCRKYLSILTKEGYAKKVMGKPQLGAYYILNRYKVDKLLNDARY